MEEKTITLKNNQQIILRLSEEWDEITFYTLNGVKLFGEFEFTKSDFNDERFHLRRMYVPYKQQGIGEQAIRFFVEITDGVIWTHANDGIVRDDGSHLTEDAPIFVGKMQNKNLIEPWTE